MIEIRELVLGIGPLTLLDSASLSLTPGERVAFLGANGSGKTTLLRTIAGLHPAAEGSILISGEMATRSSEILLPPERRNMGMVFQDLGLWPHLDVKRNILLGRLMGDHHLWRELLDSLALSDLEKVLPGRLSGGQRQRVALARALLQPVDWLLLDEPFSAIDPASRSSVAAEIHKRAEAWNAGILCSTHHQEDLELLGISRVFTLDEGRLRAEAV